MKVWFACGNELPVTIKLVAERVRGAASIGVATKSMWPWDSDQVRKAFNVMFDVNEEEGETIVALEFTRDGITASFGKVTDMVVEG